MLPAVRLRTPVDYGGGVLGAITDVRAIEAKTRLPGEIGGPSVQVTFRIVNHSRRSVSLDYVSVNAVDSTRTPANPVTTPPARALTGLLAPGAHASGVFVFSIPVSRRAPIRVTVSYSPHAPTAQFIGSVK